MILHTSLHFFFFFFNDTATTEIYTLSLHDALPICQKDHAERYTCRCCQRWPWDWRKPFPRRLPRSEEHTSELQSQSNLVCRLLLEKKKRQCRRCCAARCMPPGCAAHQTRCSSSHDD